jgi:hypothetical protein
VKAAAVWFWRLNRAAALDSCCGCSSTAKAIVFLCRRQSVLYPLACVPFYNIAL